VATSTERVPPRSYRSDRRSTQARLTRHRVLSAATAVFLARGYAGTTMRAIAGEANVSLPTVEALFGTKARILKAAIDVAIAGDDEQIAVLDRDWARAAAQAPTVEEFLAIAADVIAPAQARSAGLVLALFEGSSADVELARLVNQMITSRAETARWLVDTMISKGALRDGCSRSEAIDTMWILMDPAVYDRLTRQRQWTNRQYQKWFANSAYRLLVNDLAARPTTKKEEHR
jgi:AcrR family transcriptional regulator